MGSASAASGVRTGDANGVVSINVVPNTVPLMHGSTTSRAGSISPVPMITSGRNHHGECRA